MKRMLRVLLSLLFISILQLFQTAAQDFYPIDSANAWTYRVFYNNWPQPEDSSSRQCSIATDTTMPNGHAYRRLTQPDPLGSLFVRIDSTHISYYSPLDSSDIPMYNLCGTPGTVDTIHWGGLFTSRLDWIQPAQVFGLQRTSRHYSFDGIVQFEVTLADGFGIVEALDKADGIWPYFAAVEHSRLHHP